MKKWIKKKLGIDKMQDEIKGLYNALDELKEKTLTIEKCKFKIGDKVVFTVFDSIKINGTISGRTYKDYIGMGSYIIISDNKDKYSTYQFIPENMIKLNL